MQPRTGGGKHYTRNGAEDRFQTTCPLSMRCDHISTVLLVALRRLASAAGHRREARWPVLACKVIGAFPHAHRITSSARARIGGGIITPNAFAVRRLMTSSYS